MSLYIAVSQASDGSMLNRLEPYSEKIFDNRKTFLKSHGINIDTTTRIRIAYDEGDNFCRYKEATKGDGMLSPGKISADALVTTEINHALFLPLGDCLSAVIYEPNLHILMLSHLGRHSIEQDGGAKSIKFLIDKYNVSPENLKVWLSPAAGSSNYPLFKFNNRSLKEIAKEQMESMGVLNSNITVSPIDTTTDKNYFSHSEFLKKHRQTDGRFAVTAVMR